MTFRTATSTRNLIAILILGFMWPVLDASFALAQATTAITPTTGAGALGTTVTADGNTVQITGGTRPGDGTNLFHSFDQFSVGRPDTAQFLNTTPSLPTFNILGRVTGGSPSGIFGAIDTMSYPDANLFLMNPAGFLFGPNATVHVGGIVAFTSADYLRLTDNTQFNAIPDAVADPMLTASPVAAFGFLGSTPGVITVRGSQFIMTEGSGISLVGGNITIESDTLDNGVVRPAVLSAPAGRINFASVASPGEVMAGTLEYAPNINGQSFGELGTIQISQQSAIDTSGKGGGTILIRGGRLIVDDSTISANTKTAGPDTSPKVGTSGAGIDIQVAQDAVIDNGAVIETNMEPGAHHGSGGVRITADHITISGGPKVLDFVDANPDADDADIPFAGIRSNVESESTAASSGDISLNATSSIQVKDRGKIETNASTGTSGDLGNIVVNSIHGNVNLTGKAKVLSFAEANSSGNTGSIKIDAPLGDIILVDSELFNSANGTGTLRDIQITAHNLHLRDSSAIGGDNSSIGADNTGTQIPGNTEITLNGQLSLAGGSFINTGAFGSVASADLIISASDILITGTNSDGINSGLYTSTISSGNGGQLRLLTDNLQLTDGGILSSQSFIGFEGKIPSGDSGDISVQGLKSPGASVTIDGPGSGIFTDTKGTGVGGDISIEANSVTLQNGGKLSAASSGTIPEAIGGAITIDGNIISLSSRAEINASTNGLAPGGSITLLGNQKISAVDSSVRTNAQSIELDGGDAGRIQFRSPVIDLQGSVLTSSTLGGGDAGAIILEGSNIRLGASPFSAPLSQGTDVQASTEGTGPGGNIIIRGFQGDGSRADSVALSGVSRIITETIGNLGNEGSAGKITIEAAHLSISDSTRVGSDSQASAGDAGSIHITANKATISSQGLLSTSSDGVGNAGMIEIKAGALTMNSNGQIVSSSVQTGKAGTVTIQGLASPAQSVLIDGPGSGIFTDTEGTGAGGNISVNADSVTLQNGGTLSAKTSGTAASATGGTITVDATDQVTMTDGASITASSTGPGNAGDILIDAGQTFVATNSNDAVTTEAKAASGGNITVLATEMVQLTNSLINASVKGSKTTVGGNIIIDPQVVILQNSQILAQATQGTGGDITITTNLLLQDANSDISASSRFGVNGTVTIQSPNSPASGKIQPLGNELLETTSLLNQRCAALAGGEFSSFTVAGRDSLPTEPGNWLASPLATLSAGMGRVGKAEGVKAEGWRSVGPDDELENIALGVSPVSGSTLLSLRQVAPAGFMTQAFAVDWAAGCQS